MDQLEELIHELAPDFPDVLVKYIHDHNISTDDIIDGLPKEIRAESENNLLRNVLSSSDNNLDDATDELSSSSQDRNDAGKVLPPSPVYFSNSKKRLQRDETDIQDHANKLTKR